MNKSESLRELAPALAKAQAQVKPALKDSTNPFFKTRYADFSSILDACEEALANNGLSIIQAPIADENGIGVETMLLHSSGEYLSERFTLPVVKADAQGGGSCITYARRYALEGFMRIRREDDDGHAAAQSVQRKAEPKANPAESAIPLEELLVATETALQAADLRWDYFLKLADGHKLTDGKVFKIPEGWEEPADITEVKEMTWVPREVLQRIRKKAGEILLENEAKKKKAKEPEHAA